MAEILRTTAKPDSQYEPWSRPTHGYASRLLASLIDGLRPVRNRLVLVVMALVTIALIGSGWALFIAESHRVDAQINETLDREVAAFRAFADNSVDPDTGDPFGSPDDLIVSYLQTNLPTDTNNVLWGYFTEANPQYVGTPPAELRSSAELQRVVAELSGVGGEKTIIAGDSEYRVVVVPTSAGTQSANLVITYDVTAARQPVNDLMTAYAFIGAVAVGLIGLAATAIIATMLRPIQSLMRAAQEIHAGSLDARIHVTGHGDLAALQTAFNAMLDRLQSAFSSQRHLLDDAAHELRTPLTVVRGHLEVLEPNDPEDVLATRAMLIDETERMSRLVSDLLVLAKSDRPDFIKRTDVDVGDVTRGAVERCRGMAARYWRLGKVADTVARLDRDRITQALLQLASNSIRYTQVGGTIEIGSRVVDGRVQFWVTDDGAGVDPAIRDTLFDRLATTPDGHEGFGLGLSIVRAIVEAHHGTITLQETKRGASFLISIPQGDRS